MIIPEVPGRPDPPPVLRSPFGKLLALVLGVVCVGLALVGVVLPGVPSTPFLLLASYFLVRSSPSLHRRLMQSPVVGPLIQNWERNRAVSLRVKLWAVLVICGCLVFTWTRDTIPATLRYGIIGLICIGLMVVLRLPVKSRATDA